MYQLKESHQLTVHFRVYNTIIGVEAHVSGMLHTIALLNKKTRKDTSIISLGTPEPLRTTLEIHPLNTTNCFRWEMYA